MKGFIYAAFAATAFAGISSCNVLQSKNALAFNDTLMKMNQQIVVDATVWSDSIKAFAVNSDYSKLKPIRLNIEKDIDNFIARVTKMDAIGTTGEKFKNEELVFLKLEREVISKGFSPFETITATTTDEEKQKISAGINSLIQSEQEELKNLKSVQEEFAKEHKFKLEQKNL
jgi:hypothetical protein